MEVEMKRERLSAKTQRVPMEIEGDSQGVMKIFDLGDLGDLGGSMEMI